MILEARWAPISLNSAPPFEFARPHFSQLASDTAATAGETRRTNDWNEAMPSEDIALVSTSSPKDDGATLVRTPQQQESPPSSTPSQEDSTALDALIPRLSSRPFSPLSTPPKQPVTPPANAGGGGGGASVGGSSTPNAGMGGGGPTGGGGGPGLVNANQFVGVNFGASSNPSAAGSGAVASPATAGAQSASPTPASGPAAAAPSTAFQTTYSMTAPTTAAPQLHPYSSSGTNGSNTLYVLDMNEGETIPANTTLNTFSTWSENLEAQVLNLIFGDGVQSYSWDISQAPDFSPSTGLTSYNLQGTWASFTGPARTEIITLTVTSQHNETITQTITYDVAGTDSRAYSSSRPTSSSTWANVLTPDELSADQATGDFGSYTSYGLADGSAQTSWAMPSYNPNVSPVGLVYDSTAAGVDPVFIVHYQLGTSFPQSITADLTVNGVERQGGPVTASTSSGSYNAGDWLQFDLQMSSTGNNIGLSTGRYPWTITLTSNGSTLATYSGNVDIVNESSTPFGAGWSVDGVEQLVSVSGGVMIVDPGGTSLFFAGSGGSYTSPAGDFSTLTQNGGSYTRTMPDGTQINFNSSGQQTSIVDTDGNTTTFNYSGTLLTSITDMNGQTTTLNYGGGQLTSITDPASRTATLRYSGGDLTSITDPGNNLWQYTYNGGGRLAQLTDPNNHTLQFNYEAAGLLAGLDVVNTTISYSFVPMEVNGLAVGTSTNASAPLLAYGDQARFYDANSNPWATGIDWLGFGQDVQDLDPLGDAALTYVDPNGLPWLSADGLGRPTREFFDSKGNATEIVYPDNTTEQYQYNGYSEVTKYTDPTGDITTYSYNSKGDLTQVEDALLNVTTYGYNAAGLVTSIEDPLLHTTLYGYNSLNELTSVTNAANQTTMYAYDSAGDLTLSTDPLGYQTTSVYNTMGWIINEELPDSGTTYSLYTYGYDSVGNMTSETTPLSGTYLWNYDALNRLTALDTPWNAGYTLTYDNDNNLTVIGGPYGKTWNYGYDAAYRNTNYTDPVGTTTYGYDAANQMTSMTNALGYTTTYDYTLRGQLAKVTRPMGDWTSYSYNAAGDQTAVTQGGPSSPSYTMTYGFNALHQMTITTDQLNHSTTYGYDANGNQTSVTDPLGHAMTYAFNALNQLTSMTDALSNQTTYGYDADGNQTSITDPLGHVTTKSYDAQGRVLSVTDALTGVTSYTYDAMGDISTITDPVSNTTTYRYDTGARQISSTNSLGTETYVYDLLSHMTSKTDANGQTTSYTYNGNGQVLTEQWMNGVNPIYTATYNYDAAGQLTLASDPYSSYSFTYDQDGRESSVNNAGTPGVPAVTLTYGYDAFGNRTSLSDSKGGSVSYSYDAAKRLTNLGMTVNGSVAAQVTIGYDNANRLTGMTRTAPSVGGDTITTSYNYDNADRLTNITHKDTTRSVTLANYTYGYDKASELTSYQDNSGNSLTYGYDKVGELTSAIGTLASQSYTFNYNYDLNGNRTSTSTDVNGTLTTATYTTGTDNELSNDGTYTYTYDNNGNTLTQTNTRTGTVTNFTWDYRNRLTEEKVVSGGVTVSDEKLTYDVFNNRIGVSLNGTQQLYTVYDGANPYMDFNGSGTAVTERYLSNPLALNEFYGEVSGTGTTQWFLTDNINSVRQVISTSGSVLDAITYDPYGNILNQTNSANAPRFMYTGGAYDAISGTYLDGAREDNPVDGRWLSQDPSGLGPDNNPYRYVRNDPTNAIDSTGLEMRQTAAEEAQNGWGKIKINAYQFRKEDADEQFPEKWYAGLNKLIKDDKYQAFGAYVKITFEPSAEARKKFKRFVFLQVAEADKEEQVPEDQKDVAVGSRFIDNRNTSPIYGELITEEGGKKKRVISERFGQAGDGKKPAILIDRPHSTSAAGGADFYTFVIGDNGSGTKKFVLATVHWRVTFSEEGTLRGINFERKPIYVGAVSSAVYWWNQSKKREKVGEIVYTDSDK